MKFYAILLLVLLSNSCQTPDEWSPSNHRKMMQACKSMCGKGHVGSYEPWGGECTCHKRQ